MLQSGATSNADGLANACDVSRRTIFRDIEALKEAGVPILFEKNKDRYSIPGTYYLPPTNFTAEEALSLIVVAGQVGNNNNLPFFTPAYSAALKLESGLPAPLREELRSITRGIRIHLGPTNPAKGKLHVYQTLVDARTTGQVLKIKYGSLTEWESITTRLRPYYLLFSRRSWYVIGRSSYHSEIRTFNINRISKIENLKTKFNVPKNFKIDRYLRNAWHLIPGVEGTDQKIHVRFSPLVAQNVSEVVWHKTQRCHWREDGSLDFYAKVSGLDEIIWWIMGYGDQAEALKPEKLRRMVAQRAQRMASQYKE